MIIDALWQQQHLLTAVLYNLVGTRSNVTCMKWNKLTVDVLLVVEDVEVLVEGGVVIVVDEEVGEDEVELIVDEEGAVALFVLVLELEDEDEVETVVPIVDVEDEDEDDDEDDDDEVDDVVVVVVFELGVEEEEELVVDLEVVVVVTVELEVLEPVVVVVADDVGMNCMLALPYICS